MSVIRYIRLDPATGEPATPPDVREFTGSMAGAMARLDRMPDQWRRVDSAALFRDIASEPRADAPDWATTPGPGSPTPVVPPGEGSGLVVVRAAGRRRKGAPPATITGTDLDTAGVSDG